jgi:hypothetical protein
VTLVTLPQVWDVRTRKMVVDSPELLLFGLNLFDV